MSNGSNKQSQPPNSSGDVFVASFRHYITGEIIYAKDHGKKAFRFPPRKKK